MIDIPARDMVRLDRIYTKSGDKGKTSLGTGQRLLKSHPRIQAIGDVDELNAFLGLVILFITNKCFQIYHPDESQDPEFTCNSLSSDVRQNYKQGDTMQDLLQKIQNDLFDVGADLCMPDTKKIAITDDYVARLEQAIDDYNQHLKPLTSFVLPGGSSASTHLHLARTVCRRAERSITALSTEDTINPYLLSYINRLSDLLFVLARFANEGKDVLWEPQKWKVI